MTAILRRAVAGSRPLVALTAFSVLLALVSVGGLIFDSRTVFDQPVWLKTFKFGVSFVFYGLTLAWLMSHLTRGRKLAQVSAAVVAIAGVVELGIITAQVIRGRASHFNETTDLDALLWRAMGMTIVVLWVGTVIIGVMVWRQGLPDRAATWAVRFGLILAMAGLAEGFLMVVPTAEQMEQDSNFSGAHSVGVADGGPGMPLTGWSTTGGDLRIGHFVGMHALQALLLFAMVLPRLVHEAHKRTRLVFVFAAAYAGVFVIVTWQALNGEPLTQPSGATLAAFGGLAAATAAGTIISLRRR